jgi:hypothetical protein
MFLARCSAGAGTVTFGGAMEVLPVDPLSRLHVQGQKIACAPPQRLGRGRATTR